MKYKLKTNRILSGLAFIISTATLIALTYQSNLVREQNILIQREQYASVMPYLSISMGMGFTRSEGDQFDLNLENNGTGPAFIQEVNIRYRDSLYKEMSILEFYIKILNIENKNNIEIMRSDIKKGIVIPANKKISLFSFYTNQSEALVLLGAFATLEAEIEITYTSIYDQKWITKGFSKPHIAIE